MIFFSFKMTLNIFFNFYQSFAKKYIVRLRIGKIIVKGTGYAIYTFCTFPYKINGISLGSRVI